MSNILDLGKPMSAGNTAEIYLYNNKAYKLYKDFMPEGIAEYEGKKQAAAYNLNLPVPEIYDITRINGRPAIVMEYIEGSTFGSLISRDTASAELYMRLSVDVQRQIHSVSVDSIESMKDKLSFNLEAAHATQKLDKKNKDTLSEKLSSLSYESRLCHGDFHILNLIQNNGVVYIVDWVDASSGDIRADVYRTYLLYYLHMPEAAEMYLRLYIEASGLLKDEIFAWEPIIAGARLSEHMPPEVDNKLLEIVCKYN